MNTFTNNKIISSFLIRFLKENNLYKYNYICQLNYCISKTHLYNLTDIKNLFHDNAKCSAFCKFISTNIFYNIFIKFLKENNIYDIYFKNCKNFSIEETSYVYYISSAFSWNYTSEGWSFWDKINSKWNNIILKTMHLTP